jgi:hypothetical protein
MHTQDVLMLPDDVGKKKVRTAEEVALQRSERARKRKMMAQKMAEEEKVYGAPA